MIWIKNDARNDKKRRRYDHFLHLKDDLNDGNLWKRRKGRPDDKNYDFLQNIVVFSSFSTTRVQAEFKNFRTFFGTVSLLYVKFIIRIKCFTIFYICYSPVLFKDCQSLAQRWHKICKAGIMIIPTKNIFFKSEMRFVRCVLHATLVPWEGGKHIWKTHIFLAWQIRRTNLSQKKS